ncbi:DUF1659 domain-containing protein [Shouchella shacheensis]|uniref:DUF1659 domain-containing protein n=1 Tax=Shouchella shacheensis TaxID=1649580 RepID=UPI00073FDAB7|nr:DUF1659 domain-containing protein [Shouchella shacheensis]
MAYKVHKNSRLGLVMHDGYNDEDQPIYRRTGYAVKDDAEIEALVAVAEVFRSLCALPVMEVTLSENHELMN